MKNKIYHCDDITREMLEELVREAAEGTVIKVNFLQWNICNEDRAPERWWREEKFTKEGEIWITPWRIDEGESMPETRELTDKTVVQWIMEAWDRDVHCDKTYFPVTDLQMTIAG